MGTAPAVSEATPSVTRRRSSRERSGNSPVPPVVRIPCTPASTTWRTTLLSAASSTEAPSGVNGVGIAGMTPLGATVMGLLLGVVEEHGLCLCEEVDRRAELLRPERRFLQSPEREVSFCPDRRLVDVHDAGVGLAHEPDRLLQVVRVDGRG